MYSTMPKMENKQSLNEVGNLLADVAEDLAIEILSEATAEDYRALGQTGVRLAAVADCLNKLGIDVPFPVFNVLQNLKGLEPNH